VRIPVALRFALAAAFLAGATLSLSSCKVDKEALAKQVDLQNVDIRSVPDGTYEASYDIHPPSGVAAANKHVRVRVTVAGGRYEKIQLVEPPNLASNKTFVALADRLVESQRLSVDAISGATVTSMAVLKAVQGAVQAAGR
jgi:uncharacterized protein with FMN-binding domain